ncbi:MAG: hypothetical protein ABI566_08075 [Pseudolysinimonas sp.]
MLRTFGRAIVQCWPMVLAWFLAGWLAHSALIRLAGFVGIHESLWGLLILPLAVLAKLASYVGMFLAVRPAMRHYKRLDRLAASTPADDDTAPVRRSSFAQAWGSTIVTGLIAFLVIYFTWGMVVDDVNAYGRAAWDQYDPDAVNAPLKVGVGVMSISFVVIAFGLRLLVGRFSKRLPKWFGAISAYLEAAWLLTAALAIKSILDGVPDWLASRRMFAWIVDGIADLREQFSWFAVIGDAIAWLLNAVGEVIVLPLAWLALAAIVFAGVLPRRATTTEGRVARLRDVAGQRWRRMPRPIRVLGTSLSSSLRERWEPIATALRLVWRNGPVRLGGYLLGFAVVSVGGQWLFALIYQVLGPHDTGWWIATSDPLNLLVAAITTPLQFMLVAAAFDEALASLDEQVVSADEELAEAIPPS